LHMSLAEIKRASAEQFLLEKENSAGVSETSPNSITEMIRQFVSTFATDAPDFIPVENDPHGLYGWCSDGVHEKVKADGGKPVFGWTIWEWPCVLLTAEFHCVWQDASGKLIDITPKPKGEQSVLFVPDSAYGPDFDFDKRPLNRRMSIFVGKDKMAQVQATKSQLQGAKLRYEEGRAAKAGLSLEDWLLSKIPDEPLKVAIEEMIVACNEHEAYFDTFGPYGGFVPDEKLIKLIKRRISTQDKMKKLL